MRLKMFEGPIQRQVNDKAEFSKPISIDELQDIIDTGLEGVRKENPELAGAINQQVVKNVAAVIREEGRFTLEGLEKFNDGNNLVQSGLAKLMNSDVRDAAFQQSVRAAQLGTAFLVKFVVDWVNDGRPELMTDRKMELSIDKIRQAIEADGMKPQDREYVATMLDAFQAKHGDTISIGQLSDFHQEIQAAEEPLKQRIEARESAGLARDDDLSNQAHQYVLQSLGYYALSKYLTFSADQGELGKLAAGVKPGAAQQLGDAF